MFKFRKSVALALTTVVAASTVLSASASSTDKSLSSNFTLVNLVNGANTGTINYVLPNGTPWKDTPDPINLAALGNQLIKRQYDDPDLAAGSGSVVVSTNGPVGAVVQIQARSPQVPTFGAYVGVSAGATSASLPLVQRQRGTASGISNSQIIVQNASTTANNIEIELISGENGSSVFTKAFSGIAANASIEYDLADEASTNVPDGFFGSATIRSTNGGEVAVVSNLFNGEDTMQTFNAFTEFKTRWGIPLFASKLDNSLSTPVAVQNVGAAPIPPNSVTMTCVKDVNAPGQATLSFPNDTAIAPQASFFFNPVTNAAMPEDWYGACTVDSGTFQTAVFVQLRTVAGSRAGAHEGIPMDSTDKVAVIPLYAKRLTNGFASAITILNLSSSAPANVTLAYKGGAGTAGNCTANLTREIPAGGSLIQNHRVTNDQAGAVPELGDNCFGSLTITSSDQPVDAFAQLDLLDGLLEPDPGGDPFQAHNAFTIAP